MNQFSGSEEINVLSIKIDSTQNIYATGIFINTVDFDDCANTANMSSGGGDDTFIVKYDSNGDFSWVNSVSGIGDNSSNSIALDQKGNLYLSGYFEETVTISWDSGFTSFTSQGGNDVYLVGLNQTDGVFQFFKQIGSIGDNFAYHTHVDNQNSLYISGAYSDTVNFNEQGGTTYQETAIGEKDTFVLKLDLTSASITQSIISTMDVFPNPSKGTIQVKLTETKNIGVKIYDISGRLILSKKSIYTDNLSIQLPKDSGLYFLDLTTNQETKRVKIIREN